MAGITVATLKRICEKLHIPSDFIIFGDQNKNDAAYLIERLERLSPKQFEAVKAFMDQLFLMYAKLDEEV